MTPKQIVGSRFKYAAFAIGAVAGVLICAFLLDGRSTRPLPGVIALVVFSALAVVSALRVVRPERLTLDDAGFTLSSGLMRKPVRVEWQDTSAFTVAPTYKGAKVVKYAVTSATGSASERWLTGLWPGSVEDLAATLNEGRSRSLANLRGVA